MKTSLCAALSLFLALSSSISYAADTAPLAPGKPSGLQQAQVSRQSVFLVGGAILAVTGFALLIAAAQHSSDTPLTISGGGNTLGGSTTSTTTATTTT